MHGGAIADHSRRAVKAPRPRQQHQCLHYRVEGRGKDCVMIDRRVAVTRVAAVIALRPQSPPATGRDRTDRADLGDAAALQEATVVSRARAAFHPVALLLYVLPTLNSQISGVFFNWYSMRCQRIGLIAVGKIHASLSIKGLGQVIFAHTLRTEAALLGQATFTMIGSSFFGLVGRSECAALVRPRVSVQSSFENEPGDCVPGAF